jgi:hypothetical protein
MLPNYKIDHLGVVHQIERKPFDYATDYLDSRYHQYGALNQHMSYLRTGCISGAIGSFDSILDVGFGNGAFLSVAKDMCKVAGGYDVFDNPCLPSECERVYDITEKHWDVISFFDSLEHCESLDFVQDLKCNFVVISVPWCHYPEDAAWFEQWKHRRPDEHLHHFDDVSLVNFMSAQGYTVKYVSCIEDLIRKPTTDLPNILTAIFEKNKA